MSMDALYPDRRTAWPLALLLPGRYPRPSGAEARGCGHASPHGSAATASLFPRALPKFLLLAWLRRWIQNPPSQAGVEGVILQI